MKNQKFIRGYRAESGIIDWGDCALTKKEIDEIIKLFISKTVKKQKRGDVN